MKYIKMLSFLLCSVMSVSLKAQTLNDAKNAYFHGDLTQVKIIVNALQNKSSNYKIVMSELALLSIAVDIYNDEDDTDDELERLLEDNPNNADLHYLAGLLWTDLAQTASVFSRMSKYKNSVQSMIKAGQLAPNNERYQVEAAKAFGQPSMLGGDSDKQKPIVDKLMITNSRFAQIAMMDYLQNTQNKSEGFALIERVSTEYKGDIEVIERAAQLLWTFDKKRQAGKLFTDVCLLPAGENEAYVRWRLSCYLSAQFSLDGTISMDVGLFSINRLISLSNVNSKNLEEDKALREELLKHKEQVGLTETVVMLILNN